MKFELYNRIVLGCLLLSIALAGCGEAGNSVGSNKDDEAGSSSAQPAIFHWKLITTWPKNLPALGTAPERFADQLRRMSRGRLDIKVYGAGELVGAFEVFDAVSQGTAEMGHGAAYYWRGKIPVAAVFSTVPFGLTAQEMNGWLRYGGGLELWQRVYAPFGLRPLPGGNTGVQMAGWFNREIKSLQDLKGLRMRIPGIGGEVLKRAGGVPVTMPGSEIYTSLQKGAIDATEWVGPYNDLALGLYTAAKYYYYPGWHEPGPTLEAIINQKAWDELPEDLQAMVEVATQASNDDMLSEFTARNSAALKTLVEEHDVQLRALPDDVLKKLRDLSTEVIRESLGDDPLAREVYASYTAFLKDVKAYHAISEQAYLNIR